MRLIQRALSTTAIAVLLQSFAGRCPVAWAQDTTLIFSATGDIPYSTSQYEEFQEQIAGHNRYSPSEFFVHLGDIKNQTDPCDEPYYAQTADLLKKLAVPVFIVPGDNEYNDCSNPDRAWMLWEKYFADFEQNFCGAPVVERQEVRHENFARISKGVLLIGINLVGGSVHDEDEWRLRMQQDADWVNQQFQAKRTEVRGAVIFAHAGPNATRELFFDQFRQAAKAFEKPVLLLHGDGHAWIMDRPFPEKNILRVQVERGSLELPVQVTVTLDNQTMFMVQRNPWTGSSQPFNMSPCVEAGPDQKILLPQSANLRGRVSDDGEPNPPGAVVVTWSKVSGPGVAAFRDANAPRTEVGFDTPGTYVLRLTADDGQFQSSDETTIVANLSQPIISSFNPTSGPAGTGVEISGSNFINVKAVTFNATAANFRVDSEARIWAIVPAGATTGKIGVTNWAGSALSATDFTVTSPLPIFSFFAPLHDTYVQSSFPAGDSGASSELRQSVTGDDTANAYLKFTVMRLSGPVVSAKLRLYVTDASSDGGSVYLVSNNHKGTSTPWTEAGLTWNNAPVINGMALSVAGAVSIGSWVELDVTSAIPGDGIYSFGLKNLSSDTVLYSSKDGANMPELIIATRLVSDVAPAMTTEHGEMPEQNILFSNYPNPFNGQTIIEYALPEAAKVGLFIYNIRGQWVRKLVDESQAAGNKQVQWDGRDDYGQEVVSGVYLIRLEAGHQRFTRHITLLK